MACDPSQLHNTNLFVITFSGRLRFQGRLGLCKPDFQNFSYLPEDKHSVQILFCYWKKKLSQDAAVMRSIATVQMKKL